MRRRTRRKLIGIIIAAATVLTAGGGLGTSLLMSQPVQDTSNLLTPVLFTPSGLTVVPVQPTPPVQPTGGPTPGQPASAPAPAGTVPLAGSTDLGIESQGNGQVVAAGSGRVACDDSGTMRVTTADGTVLAGISQDGGWSCQAALAQWGAMAAKDGDVGARFAPASNGQPAKLQLIDSQGHAMTSFVTGAWSPD